jgi:hypothetical protein
MTTSVCPQWWAPCKLLAISFIFTAVAEGVFTQSGHFVPIPDI